MHSDGWKNYTPAASVTTCTCLGTMQFTGANLRSEEHKPHVTQSCILFCPGFCLYASLVSIYHCLSIIAYLFLPEGVSLRYFL